MFSHLFVRSHPKSNQSRFASVLFLALVIVFAVISFSKVVVGLAGIGTVALVGATLVELDRAEIWEGYKKGWKKHKGLHPIWGEPKLVYYNLNVYVLWPLVALLGAYCLWVAYLLA